MKLHKDQKQFDAFAKNYEVLFIQNHPRAYKRFALELKRVLKLIKQPLKVLDVGCGTGYTVNVMIATKTKGTYLGIDTSEQSLAILENKKKNSHNMSLKTICCSAQALLNKTNGDHILKKLGTKPNLIVCNASFHQINKTFPHIELLIKAFHKLLRKDGIIILGDYFYPEHLSKAQISKSRQWIRKQIGQNPTKASGFLSPNTISKMLTSVGFSIKTANICRANDVIDLNYYIVRCNKD